MEKGFFHKSVGYWQTNAVPSAKTMAAYPTGTVEVPLMPSGNFDWDGSKWVELPPDLDIIAAAARSKRNTLLSQSDWTQIPDAPVDQAAWATYRQALRDITSQEGFPEAITWPVAPN